MLQMRMYSERTVDQDGIVTRTGEDALPYGNQAGMFVADGMGGSAGVAVLRFHPDCFDGDRLAARLSRILASSHLDGSPEFAAYVKENFASLTDPAVRQLYQDPAAHTLRLKKSGYVGSHALGFVMAAWLLVLEEYQKQAESGENWEADIRRLKDSLFDNYQQAIRLLEAECARVSIQKIDYFGTTLSAAFFREKEDSVEVIFLNCGDSRSYVWDAGGFRQASEDQGRKGGMTSRFCLGKEVPRISFEKKTYSKPCVFLCMTDGVYGAFGGRNGFHSTPLYMEGFLMNQWAQASSLEEAQQRLQEMFDARGQTDDSNSLVMTAFGYEDYGAFQTAARQRLEELNREYGLDHLPEAFLVEDYQKAVQRLQRDSTEALRPLLEKAYGLPAVQEHCRKQAGLPAFRGRYGGEQSRIQAETAEQNRKCAEIQNELYRLAGENFLDFVPPEAPRRSLAARVMGSWGSSPQEKAANWGAAYQRDFFQRSEVLERFRWQLKNTCDAICLSVETVRRDPLQGWDTGAEQASLEWARRTEAQIREMAGQMGAWLQDMADLSRSLTTAQRQWSVENQKAMAGYCHRNGSVSPMELVSRWLSAPVRRGEPSLAPHRIPETTIPSVRIAMERLVERYQAAQEQLMLLREEEEAALRQAAGQYWEEHAVEDLPALLEQGAFREADPELEQRIRGRLEQNEELNRCRKLWEEQQAVFGRYLEAHLSEVSEEKRADVEKYGWM